MNNIKLVIIDDPMGEETDAEYIERLSEDSNINPNLFEVLRHDKGISDETLDAMNKADIVIIDYGGMLPGCDDMVSFQIREFCKWAENHPSKLAILWTLFTSEIYQNEFSVQFGHCDNIIIHYTCFRSEYDKECYDASVKKITDWINSSIGAE